jgi:hypothetical protein
MFGALHRRARRVLVSGLLSVAALGAIAVSTLDIDLPGHDGDAGTVGAFGRSGPCGSRTFATVAGVEESVARRIYVAELRGYELRADLAHIAGSSELLSALQASDRAGLYAAVHNIVYTPHWHIVRLRVLQRGHVLADVGGPDVIAPVSGTLRIKGKVVASFVMSVQDDLGYTKLVSRFIGVPIALYEAGSFVMGTIGAPAAAPSDGQVLALAGRRYRTVVLEAKAFPTGALQAALFLPIPSSASSALSCESVRVAEWGSIAAHVAARFTPLSAHYKDFLHTLQGVSGGLVFVRSGQTQLAGAGPARLPRQGAVRYQGRLWDVFSWKAQAPARIYFLTPAD